MTNFKTTVDAIKEKHLDSLYIARRKIVIEKKQTHDCKNISITF